MVLELLVNFWERYRPQGGWLSPLLLLMVIIVLIISVLTVGWVPEDGVILPTALLGLLMGLVLARRPLPTWAAWTFIIIYGLILTTVTLASLWPPLHLLLTDWPELRLYWLGNGAQFLERAAVWFIAVFSGSRSNETIVFAFLMGLFAWFLGAYTGWSAFRLRRPLLGLTLTGLIVAFNGYYGKAPIELIITFTGVALLATAVLHFSNLEISWQDRKVDYSREIRLEMFAYAAGIGITLLAMAYFLPTTGPTKLASAVLGQPAVLKLEEKLDRAFGGVQVARGRQPSPGQAGGAGIMPRSFLLGNPPELQKNIMLTAETELISGPDAATLDFARHWRGLSYVRYTGRGWSLSDERVAHISANQAIAQPAVREAMLIEQTVNWRYDNRVIRYTLGLPLRFDQPVATHWRGQTDFVRALTDDIPRYKAHSRVSAATPAQLRETAFDQIPPSIRMHYTQLPVNLPDRIHDLAAEIAGDSATSYDQALAIERFLRQYHYSLDVELPKEGLDPVDYFLFDLQEGYCDYYASSMVVMARSLDLPARFATGFLAQPVDENGIQIVRQIDAHSWAEVYFAGYGWIEFEPTATFQSPHDPLSRESAIRELEAEPQQLVEPPPIPDRAPRQPFSWFILAALLMSLLLVSAAILWFVRRPRSGNEVRWAYSRLQNRAQKLGHSLSPSQTVYEFGDDLDDRLDHLAESPRMRRLIDVIKPPINKVTNLYVQQQYSQKPVQNPKEAVSLWRRIRRPMWILWLISRLHRKSKP